MSAISVTAFTDTGLVRTRNEDAVLVGGWLCQSAAGSVVTMSFPPDPPFVCAVADGMGGHAGGDLASRVALGVIADAAPAWRTPENVLASLRDANTRVFQVGDNPDLRGLGTTIAGICVFKTEVVIFNVGDSRVYSVESSFLQQLSTDDALVGDGGRPTSTLTQSIGQHDPVNPHITSRPRDGANYLVCSDGVSGVITASGLRAAALKLNPEEVAGAIIDTARANGAQDNFSFAVISVPAMPVGVAPRAVQDNTDNEGRNEANAASPAAQHSDPESGTNHGR